MGRPSNRAGQTHSPPAPNIYISPLQVPTSAKCCNQSLHLVNTQRVPNSLLPCLSPHRAAVPATTSDTTLQPAAKNSSAVRTPYVQLYTQATCRTQTSCSHTNTPGGHATATPQLPTPQNFATSATPDPLMAAGGSNLRLRWSEVVRAPSQVEVALMNDR